jgi:adenylyltransferase/sulfurtransferase
VSARYSRQVRYEPIGEGGQARIRAAGVVLVGCGALGSVAADQLVRAGVGRLRLIDRDFIELSNLQRQSLFDEDDIAAGLPKAEAATRKLRRVNHEVAIEGVVADLNASDIARLCGDADVIVDGTDNVETRYLINDFAVKTGRPWVYAGCVGAEGRVLAVVPGRGACLRCIWDEPPPPGALETCDTAGVLASAAAAVASLAVIETLKLIVGRQDELGGLIAVELWRGQWRRFAPRRDVDQCPCCALHRFEFLDGRRGSATTTLCGRNAVQILPAAACIDLDALERRLRPFGDVRRSAYLLQAAIGEYTITLFPDGRAIIQGTTDASAARSVLARYVGM